MGIFSDNPQFTPILACCYLVYNIKYLKKEKEILKRHFGDTTNQILSKTARNIIAEFSSFQHRFLLGSNQDNKFYLKLAEAFQSLIIIIGY